MNQRPVFDKFISGYPSKKKKRRGDLRKPIQWKNSVLEATRGIKPLNDKECVVRINFYFAPEQYPLDLPYGPDLDNYMKSLFDFLNETLFRNTRGGDSCIKKIIALKHKSSKKIGARIQIWQ